MIDARSKAVFQDLVRRESRSLLQYVSESFPWTTREEQKALARLQEMVQEETRGIAAVVRFLAKNHVVPPLPGPFSMAFTNINYMSLDHLVPLLIESQRQRVAELEASLAGTADADSRRQAETYLDMKRRHAGKLEELLKGLGKNTAVAT